jgi:hypothetical protein
MFLEKKSFRYWLSIAKIAALISIPIVLLLLPADYFDGGESVCLSVRFFDMECPGCGMTRAIMHLIHFDINEAAYYNLLSFLVLPLLIYVWAGWVLRAVKDFMESKSS